MAQSLRPRFYHQRILQETLEMRYVTTSLVYVHVHVDKCLSLQYSSALSLSLFKVLN